MSRGPGHPLVGTGQAPRIMLYAHNGASFGHIARIGALAAYIKQELPHACIACVSGSRHGSSFMPEGADYLKLPGYTQEEIFGNVVNIPSLGVPWEDFVLLRRGLLYGILQMFKPHLFIADTVAEGSFSELSDLIVPRRGRLNVLVTQGILDSSESVRTRMHAGGMLRFIRSRYDYVFSFMDRKVFDMEKEYGLESLSERLIHCGYILRPMPRRRARPAGRGAEKRVVAAVGGGGVALPLIEAIISSRRHLRIPAVYRVYTGAYVSAEQVARLKRRAPRGVSVERFTDDMPGELARADLFVGAGGYNQLVEVLHARVPSLIIPWQRSEDEQLVHTRRLHSLGAVSAYLTRDETTPQSLARAIDRLLREGARPRPSGLDLDGGRHAARHIRSLLERGRP